jgi:hypothetical protein
MDANEAKLVEMAGAADVPVCRGISFVPSHLMLDRGVKKQGAEAPFRVVLQFLVFT